MSDQLHQAKAVRVQSSAIVVAAVITTCGAVASALIQTGLTGKSTSSAAGGSATFAANTSASVSSPVEPVPEVALPAAQLAAANMPASLTRPTCSMQVQAEAVEMQAQAPRQATIRTKWTTAKPELEATGGAKPMVSPWYYLSHPDGQTTAVKTTKKTFDWGGVTKILPWLN
jgi:hypothetical protein